MSSHDARRRQRPCRHLRAKAMYYTPLVTPGRDDAGAAGSSRDEPEADDRNHYWCLKSCRQLGPGNVRLGADECVPGRECYEGDAPAPLA